MKRSVGFLCCLGAVVSLVGGCANRQVQVQQHGRMHDVLSSDQPQSLPAVRLAEVQRRPGAVGVGALAGLEGEVTIYDGQVWVARPAGGDVRVEGPTATSEERAVLLTAAHVEKWREVTIDAELSGAELERFISEHARKARIDPDKPFPFTIDGELRDLRMHVTNGTCPMRPGAWLMVQQQPWRYDSQMPGEARIVGFYARDSVGRMTHPGTSMHANALVNVGGRELTGHVERLAVARGSVLRLPVLD